MHILRCQPRADVTVHEIAKHGRGVPISGSTLKVRSLEKAGKNKGVQISCGTKKDNQTCVTTIDFERQSGT